ncbi:D-glycero-beta-D-manno-heptose 1,7-bisphosphate 7-phosphatase [Vreelandella malpeensis]|uniref:D,D-heptose 1,7-bisphosphate phosphatase n=1 Tax=Vreelandella malpeensis TaxID=1172368 RepID=A0ABS8DWC8_9GAMM|nr:D-glycero-beta-D-manno-heptose 1,7-bisphosphate 7-phosphatase [Halomonas malpeensis]MCB8890637.1 D-glycero-beta-D-manno-heptose 1,7-bisphosphate 7-phosphatase [Halomonas malpeensis]
MPISASRLVILDRDGVINQDSDHYVKSLEEWVAYPTSIAAIGELTRAGFTVAIATNQSGIGRGYFDEQTLEAMHDKLEQLVENAEGRIAHIAYCPHVPDDDCHCRKPLPGLLLEIQQALGLDTLEGSWMVGDSLRDLQAGEAVGCQSVLVKTGKGQRTLEKGQGLKNARVFDDLATFTDWLCRNG